MIEELTIKLAKLRKELEENALAKEYSQEQLEKTLEYKGLQLVKSKYSEVDKAAKDTKKELSAAMIEYYKENGATKFGCGTVNHNQETRKSVHLKDPVATLKHLISVGRLDLLELNMPEIEATILKNPALYSDDIDFDVISHTTDKYSTRIKSDLSEALGGDNG